MDHTPGIQLGAVGFRPQGGRTGNGLDDIFGHFLAGCIKTFRRQGPRLERNVPANDTGFIIERGPGSDFLAI